MSYSPFHFDFPYRAHRDYVHSASLCNLLAERFPNCRRIELVLKHWMDSRVIFTPVDSVRAGQGTGYAKLALDGEDLILELSQDSAFPVDHHEPYDEDALVADGVTVNSSRTCHPGAGGSFWDRLIAANKALINDSLNPGVKLIAAKIVVEGTPADMDVFTLDLVSHAGTRIFKSRLSLDGKTVGEVIYYGQ